MASFRKPTATTAHRNGLCIGASSSVNPHHKRLLARCNSDPRPAGSAKTSEDVNHKCLCDMKRCCDVLVNERKTCPGVGDRSSIPNQSSPTGPHSIMSIIQGPLRCCHLESAEAWDKMVDQMSQPARRLAISEYVLSRKKRTRKRSQRALGLFPLGTGV